MPRKKAVVDPKREPLQDTRGFNMVKGEPSLSVWGLFELLDGHCDWHNDDALIADAGEKSRKLTLEELAAEREKNKERYTRADAYIQVQVENKLYRVTWAGFSCMDPTLLLEAKLDG